MTASSLSYKRPGNDLFPSEFGIHDQEHTPVQQMDGPAARVSVVMPVFNQEKYIGDAVRCVLRQTFKNFELLVVDDGSTDRTVDVVNGFDDARVRLIRKEHTGFISTLVRGYREAQGEWIARMDSDDLCRPERLERQMSFLEGHPECGFVGTAYGYVTPNGYCLEPRDQFEWRYVEPSEITLGGRVFGDPTVVFRRDLGERVGFYDPDFNNENPLWYMLLGVSKGAVLGSPLYFGRWLVTSLSRSSSQEFLSSIGKGNAFLDIRDKYDPENSVKLVRDDASSPDRSLTGKLKYGLVIYLSAGDRGAAIRLTWDGWKAHPFSLVRAKLLAYALLGIIGVRTGTSTSSRKLMKRCESPLQTD